MSDQSANNQFERVASSTVPGRNPVRGVRSRGSYNLQEIYAHLLGRHGGSPFLLVLVLMLAAICGATANAQSAYMTGTVGTYTLFSPTSTEWGYSNSPTGTGFSTYNPWSTYTSSVKQVWVDKNGTVYTADKYAERIDQFVANTTWGSASLNTGFTYNAPYQGPTAVVSGKSGIQTEAGDEFLGVTVDSFLNIYVCADSTTGGCYVIPYSAAITGCST